ncbi:hypothetical protein ACVWXU_005691 [Streptomyces sp. TE33382]
MALLDLEPQDVPVQTGPVPFSSASLEVHDVGADSRGGQAAEGAAAGRGVFGPPVPPPPAPQGPPAPPPFPSAFPSASASSASAFSSFPSVSSVSAAETESGAGGLPGQRTPDPRFSVTVNAENRPGDARRGRRVSCTVALAVASALAVVMVGTGLLGNVLPGGGTDAQKGNDAAATPPASTGKPSPDDSASEPSGSGGRQVDELPKEFIGTWKGELTERTTGQPHGVLTAVFTRGKRGSDVVRMTTTVSSLGISVSCHSVGTLASGTAQELTFDERTDPDRPGTAGLCTTTTAEVVFARSDGGKLFFRSKERGAGLPYGTLARSGR